MNGRHETAIESDTGTQLWGIYYRDREFAMVKGDPLRTVISAQTKEKAEQEASRLGFEESLGRILSRWKKRKRRNGCRPTYATCKAGKA